MSKNRRFSKSFPYEALSSDFKKSKLQINRAALIKFLVLILSRQQKGKGK